MQEAPHDKAEAQDAMILAVKQGGRLIPNPPLDLVLGAGF